MTKISNVFTNLLRKIQKLETQKKDEKSEQPTFLPLIGKECLRVVLFVQHPSVWNSWKTVYEAMKSHSKIYVNVVLTPFYHHLSSADILYSKMKQMMIENNISFSTLDSFSFDSFRPHVVFLQNPYESTRPSELHVENIRRSDARIVYIPYALEAGGGSWNASAQFDLEVQRSAWRIFVCSNEHKKMYAHYCSVGNGHVIVTGHPKFDLLKKSNMTIPKINHSTQLKEKINSRKVVLWTPHFSVGRPIMWSTFEIYKDAIFESFLNQDLFLLIRPHPLFFHSMISNNVWTEEDEKNFRDLIKSSNNIGIDDSSDYQEAFAFADALMTDAGSFLLEFLPTHKPILYLSHPEGLGLLNEKDLLEGYYVASSAGDIEKFITYIQENKDPLKSSREVSIPNFIFGLDGNIGQRICEHILLAVETGCDASPDFEKMCESSEKRLMKFDETMLNIAELQMSSKEIFLEKEKTLRIVLEKMKELKNTIDINSQDGYFSHLLKDYSNKVDAFGRPLALVNQAISQYESANLHFTLADIDHINLFEKYDTVFCMDRLRATLEESELLKLLTKLPTLLKSDGRLILVDVFSKINNHTVVFENQMEEKYRRLSDCIKLFSQWKFDVCIEECFFESTDDDRVGMVLVFEFIN